MKTSVTLCAVLLATTFGAAAGCRSETVPQETHDVNAVIDQAVAYGADIPAGKRNTVIRMLSLSEKDLILGLRVFATLSGGRYPARLDT